jgi:predicted phosphodiesterase
MRYFVLSDIHSNVEALEACCRRAKDAGYDSVVCCGDIVGYGPQPNEVIDILRELNVVAIRGIHDRVAAGLDEADDFNPYARTATQWTRDQLSPEHREYLAALPVGPLAVTPEAQLMHGALTNEDDYIFTTADAAESFCLTTTTLTFFGHTHLPVIYDRRRRYVPPRIFHLDPDGQFLVNPGSVGQPRAGDPRASFLIWDVDDRVLEFYRVEYPLSRTQEKMRDVELPEYLIARLAVGR